MLFVHVDDTAATGPKSKIHKVLNAVMDHFGRRIAEDIHGQQFLRIFHQKNRAKGTLKLPQRCLIQNLLEKQGLQECRPLGSPLDHHVQMEARSDDIDTSVTSIPQPH
jgi:hypothetical protein